MQALGLLFVGTALLLLIGHAAEVFGRHRPAGSHSDWRHTPFRICAEAPRQARRFIVDGVP